MYKIEMKIQGPKGTRWEDQPVYAKIELTDVVTRGRAETIADEIGLSLANHYGCQTRWNWEEIGQGHYNCPHK